MKHTSVVVALDLSENSMPAVRAAAWLCRELSLTASLVYSVEPEADATVLAYLEEGKHTTLADWAKGHVEELHAELFEGIPGDVRIVENTHAASEAICDVAKDVDAKLIVMGTHGRTAIEHAFFGSTATSVVRHAGIDVLTVRPRLEGGDLDIKLRNWVLAHGTSVGIRKILCPVDFSSGSERALKRAAGLAQEFEAELSLLHTVTYPFWASREELTLAAERTRAEAREKMTALEARVRTADVEVTGAIADGTPSEEIVKAALEGDVDLIVMGTHGRTGLKRWAIGSVAERTVRTSPVPVWTVKLDPDAS
jgi:nucleotide-binding universal stress UspA family protein